MVITPEQEFQAVVKAFELTKEKKLVWKQIINGATKEYSAERGKVSVTLTVSNSTMILRFTNQDGRPFDVYRPKIDTSKVKQRLLELVGLVEMEVEIEKEEKNHPLLQFLKEEPKAVAVSAETTSHIDSDLFDRPRE